MQIEAHERQKFRNEGWHQQPVIGKCYIFGLFSAYNRKISSNTVRPYQTHAGDACRCVDKTIHQGQDQYHFQSVRQGGSNLFTLPSSPNLFFKEYVCNAWDIEPASEAGKTVFRKNVGGFSIDEYLFGEDRSGGRRRSKNKRSGKSGGRKKKRKHCTMRQRSSRRQRNRRSRR